MIIYLDLINSKVENTKPRSKNKFWIILSLFLIFNISLNTINRFKNEEERISLTISDELIRSGTFEMPYTLAACMIINGFATNRIEWTFESSKQYIAITLEIQYCKETCGDRTILSDGTKYNDSGVYQVENEGIYEFLFWNKDNDQERTNITYYIVFDPGMDTPSIPSFPLVLLGLVSLSSITILLYRLEQNRSMRLSKKKNSYISKKGI